MSTDIDECQSNNGNCDQICVNEVGTYHCDCRSGYQLEFSGVKCQGNYNVWLVNFY